MAEYHLDDSEFHSFWDNSFPARLEIERGDTVVFECRDASGSQVTPESSHDFMDHVDGSLVHALTGPVFIKGAQPGDTLVVEILNLKHKGWGFNAVGGLLADEFTQPYLQHWQLDDDKCYLANSDKAEVPFEPFSGIMGVAPAEAGRFGTSPPGFHGGNVDIRGLTIGATVYIPVGVEGALFSTGDCHAAQGDGEVSGMGIESPMSVTLRFDVRKDMSIKELRFATPSPLTKADNSGYYCTTAHGPDLYVNSQNAVRYMLDWLTTSHGFTREQAYCLCSAAADLKISQIVNSSTWTVSFYFPLSVLV